VAVLASLGLTDTEMLQQHARPPVLGGGVPAGSMRATGALTAAAP
jgi:hypothetical protein